MAGLIPDLKDHNSSNCLLNAFAIKNHLDKYHIHSYAYDLAALVRQGNMKREDALKKLKLMNLMLPLKKCNGN